MSWHRTETTFKHLLDCNKDCGDFLSVTHKRLQSIREANKQRNNDFHIQLNDETHYETHKQCVSTYTSRTHISRYLKRNNIITDVRVKYLLLYGKSLFCGEECCMTPDPKNPKRWRKSFECRTSDKEVLIKKLFYSYIIILDNY